jgi:flagellar motor switch protein FliM
MEKNLKLSNDEIHALLQGLPVSQSAVEESDDIVPYDLSRKNRIIRGHLPGLDSVHDRFAQNLQQTLSTHLRKSFRITRRATELVNYSDFIEGAGYPSSLTLFHLAPLRGTALLNFEQRLIHSFIDLMFGGDGRLQVRDVERDFTRIEYQVITKIVHSALIDLRTAWKPLVPLKIRFERTETNPRLVQIVSDDEIVVATTFDVELNRIPMTMSVCVPYLLLDPIRSRLAGGAVNAGAEVSPVNRARLEAHLRKSAVEVRFPLGNARLSLRKFLSLQVGDHLVLDQPKDGPLNGYVQNVLKFKGFQGAYKGQRAIRIQDVVQPTAQHKDEFDLPEAPESTESPEKTS